MYEYVFDFTRACANIYRRSVVIIDCFELKASNMTHLFAETLMMQKLI